jgi:predicted MFS family arabinose efflux permease
LTLFASPIFGRLADQFGKLRTYRIIAPLSAMMFLAITHLSRVPLVVVIGVFGVLMVCNVGRMIAAMAMITGSVQPHRRGGFLSANSSVQHIACGIAAYIGGLIITQTEGGPVGHFGAVGWIAGVSTLATLWLAGRVRPIGAATISAEQIGLAAAAEATVDAGELLITAAEDR